MTEEQPEGKSKGSQSHGIFTVIIVIIIMVALVGIILPVLNVNMDQPRRQSECGKSQSQMLGALIVYQTSYDVSYPIPLNLKLGKGMTAH